MPPFIFLFSHNEIIRLGRGLEWYARHSDKGYGLAYGSKHHFESDIKTRTIVLFQQWNKSAILVIRLLITRHLCFRGPMERDACRRADGTPLNDDLSKETRGENLADEIVAKEFAVSDSWCCCP